MPQVTKSHRRNLRQELEDGKRKLEEGCRRLEELLRRREEEIKKWEEMAKFLREESARRQAEHRETEQQWRALLRKAQEDSTARGEVMKQAWNHYEQRWKTILSASSLTFRSIPWPILSKVTLPEALVPHLISQFILSPEHSPTESRRRRIHAALLRWHTDRFDTKVLHKVIEKDRPAVKDGVGRVVRCLNDMLTAEGGISMSV